MSNPVLVMHYRLVVNGRVRCAFARYNGSRTVRDIRNTLSALLDADLQSILAEMDGDVTEGGKDV